MRAVGRLAGELGGHTGLAAVGRHLTELISDGMKLLRGLLLLDGRLVTGLSLGFAEQVTCLLAGLRDDLPSLVGRGLRDLAARLAGMLADACRLVAGDVGRGRLARRFSGSRGVGPRILSHSTPSPHHRVDCSMRGAATRAIATQPGSAQLRQTRAEWSGPGRAVCDGRAARDVGRVPGLGRVP